MPTREWQRELSLVIAGTLRTLLPSLNNDELAMLALDCHPWNAGLFLAVLTQSEVDADPLLADPAEMAAWNYYDCGEQSDKWVVDSLCETMRQDYYNSEDRDTIAQAYFRSCGAAISDELVSDVLNDYRLRPDFRVSVTHPDDGTEFCTQEDAR
ncbi:MAG: hypothetical protein R3C18_11325 [Planctomycetaceae bacterium]